MTGKIFRFSLDAVLRLRVHEAEQARLALAAARKAHEKARRRQEQIQKLLDEVLHRPAASNAVADLRRLGELRAEALRANQQQFEVVARTGREVDAAVEALRASLHDQEALERLRETERAAFDEETARAEQKDLDELGVIAHKRIENLASN